MKHSCARPGSVIRVLLADDHRIVREGIRALVEADGDLRVVGEAANGREAVTLAKKLRPKVVVIDVAMPLLNGIEATRQILSALPKTRVLILSAHSDEEYVERALSIGASGYVIKQSSAKMLALAIREICAGKIYVSPSLPHPSTARAGISVSSSVHARKSVRLTPRETEVVQLVAEGKANKQIAAELGISIKTVEKHRQNLMDKLNIHDTAGLTRYAITERVIESGLRVTVNRLPGSSKP